MNADGNPAAGACCYTSIVVDAEHVGDVGPGEVDIKNANGVAGEGKRESELSCDRGFAYSAFAGQDLYDLWLAESS